MAFSFEGTINHSSAFAQNLEKLIDLPDEHDNLGKTEFPKHKLLKK